VTRTLAWHIASKEVNPNLGNQTLLREIELTPGASKRIVPAFVIGTCTLWERGAVDALKETMERHQVRALRLFPHELNHTLREIEPLVEELLALSPTLLIDHRSLPPTEDISTFAARFPDTPIIYSSAAWSQLPTALDSVEVAGDPDGELNICRADAGFYVDQSEGYYAAEAVGDDGSSVESRL